MEDNNDPSVNERLYAKASVALEQISEAMADLGGYLADLVDANVDLHAAIDERDLTISDLEDEVRFLKEQMRDHCR